MIDFSKFREQEKSKIIDPIEIFKRLPKPDYINDLYVGQADVLNQWLERKNQDNIIKIQTGGGKTLVGLLIGQSSLNELGKPVLYLCPNNQLVEQATKKAKEYGIEVVNYEKKKELNREFLNAEKIMICNYHSLFNGKSKFGLNISNSIEIGAIILDDAHAVFSTIRDIYSIKIDKKNNEESYKYLTDLFIESFNKINRSGTFNDIVNNASSAEGIVEIPYWDWVEKLSFVQSHLDSIKDMNEYIFSWPLVRDYLKCSHAIVSKKSFVITPYFPAINLFPSFDKCKRRIFMSATIKDDSTILRTFNINKQYLFNPIISDSIAGVGEKMILFPEIMNIDGNNSEDVIDKILERKVDSNGLIILVSSEEDAKKWESKAKYPETPDKVSEIINEMQSGKENGPVVFANRYDGIDLPGNTCRYLILSGLPYIGNEYDLFIATVLSGSKLLNTNISIKIEQGIGRGSRGPKDFCIIIFLDKKLINWIFTKTNQNFLTSSTRKQIDIGKRMSQDIDDFINLFDLINKCIERDKEWIKFHNESLAAINYKDDIDKKSINLAAAERESYNEIVKSNYEQAIKIIDTYLNDNKKHLTKEEIGWLYQNIGKIYYFKEDYEKSKTYQISAFKTNENLYNQIGNNIKELNIENTQAEEIFNIIENYNVKSIIKDKIKEGITDHISQNATPNQFEEAVSCLGKFLGFKTDRPDHNYKKGPDILWIISKNTGIIFEAKSRKKTDSTFKKEDSGQILNSHQWFLEEYKDHNSILVSIHPNKKSSKSVNIGNIKVLTIDNLLLITNNVYNLYEQLIKLDTGDFKMFEIQCDKLLKKYCLKWDLIEQKYFEDFIQDV